VTHEQEGATYHVIQQKGKVVQFSKQDGNYELLSPDIRNKYVHFTLGTALIVQDEAGVDEVVGALFLNQYANRPFSEISHYLLGLFARQAALVIKNQRLFRDRDTFADGNKQLSEAIAVIAQSSDITQMYQEIVYRCRSLTSAQYVYLAILKEGTSQLTFEAVSPAERLFRLRSDVGVFDYKRGNMLHKKADGTSIHFGNIEEFSKEYPEDYAEYIDFKTRTRSELAVPILIESDRKNKNGNDLLGVINLESEELYAFTQIHKDIVEHLAKHVAIALQKRDLLFEIGALNSRFAAVKGLLEDLDTIRSLKDARPFLNQICRVISCDAIVVVPMKISGKTENRPQIISDSILTSNSRYSDRRDHFARVPELSEQVFEVGSISINDSSHSGSVYDKGLKEIFDTELPGSILCIRMGKDAERIGVVWFCFNEVQKTGFSEAGKAICQIIASHIATVVRREEAKSQYEELMGRKDITKNLDVDINSARSQLRIYNLLTSIISFSAVLFFVVGLVMLLPPNNIELGIPTAIAGVIIQMANLFVIRIHNRTISRVDEIYRGLFRLHQLNVFINSAKTLRPDIREQLHQELLRAAAKGTFEQEINNSQNNEKE
jgi:GAF domain-containing protein